MRYRDYCIFVLSCLFHAKTFVCTPFLYYVYRISYGSALRAHKTLDDVKKVIETMLQVLHGVDWDFSDISERGGVKPAGQIIANCNSPVI